MFLFILIFSVLFYYFSEITYSSSKKTHYSKKEKCKFKFKKYVKTNEDTIEFEEKEYFEDGISVGIVTETKKSTTSTKVSLD